MVAPAPAPVIGDTNFEMNLKVEMFRDIVKDILPDIKDILK